MDDNAKNSCAQQVDQELLDARGINMTVEEVSGLSTSKYAAKVQSLKLGEDDLIFLKALRRRIKNRIMPRYDCLLISVYNYLASRCKQLASQNSRRRSVEHLRRLTRELRVVRACRHDALAERRALVERRDSVRDKCASLRLHIVQILQERSDKTEVPSIDVDVATIKVPIPRKVSVTETKIPHLPNQHLSVIVKNDIDRSKLPVQNDIDREKLRKELEKEKDIYERVRQELQKEIFVKDTVEMKRYATETLIVKEEMPDYEEISIQDDFESVRREFLQKIRNSVDNFDDRRDSDSLEDGNDLERRRSSFHSKNSTFETRNFKSERSDSISQNYENNSSSDELEMRYDNYIRAESSDRDIFECKIGKLVTQSVNHIFNDKRKVFAKTVFISNEKLSSDIQTMVLSEGQNEVLNLSVKEGRKKSHGRKQSAPRRIAYYEECDNMVLDLKMRKDPQ